MRGRLDLNNEDGLQLRTIINMSQETLYGTSMQLNTLIREGSNEQLSEEILKRLIRISRGKEPDKGFIRSVTLSIYRNVDTLDRVVYLNSLFFPRIKLFATTTKRVHKVIRSLTRRFDAQIRTRVSLLYTQLLYVNHDESIRMWLLNHRRG
jgi:hypothetical protein